MAVFASLLQILFSSFNNIYYYSALDMLPPRPAETGKKVGEYLFAYGELIGRGNFARVFRGVHLPTGQAVAVKAISLDMLKSKRLEALVFEEIRVLQIMDHPNVLRLREALLSDRNCYIITELCPNGNLEERVRRGPLSNGEVARIVLQLVEGLRYLRGVGVVHRDFKTANIFLSNGLVKIADFGLAKLYKERFHDMDVGSPHYMSPEGLLLNVYGEKTDIWSLGIILYEITHGRTPFEHCQDERDLQSCIVRPLPDAAFRKDLHPCFKLLIAKLLEVDENRRPTVADLLKDPLLEALKEMLRGEAREGRRKFSFSEKASMATLFHKKTEASLQTAVLMPPAVKPSQNKSVELTPSLQLRSNQSFFHKPLQNNAPPTPASKLPLPFPVPALTVPLKPTSSQLWEGGSTKTNETKEDWEEESRQQRIKTQRSFWD